MFLKTNIFKAITFKNGVQLPFTYWILVILRFALTLWPQSGYIHPDEYFQNVEVIAGDVFDIEISRTWEFDPKFPIRNIFVPKLVLSPPLNLIRILNPFMKSHFQVDLKTPYFLLVIPRLFICALSLINDYCLYKLCVLYGQNFRNRLKIFASSYVVLVYGTRSFSNNFEMIFFSLLLYLVGDCMLKSDKIIYHKQFLDERYKQALTPAERVRINKLQSHIPQHSLNYVFVIASIVVVGTFNRPTFIGFAFVPIFFWLHRGLGTQVVGFVDFHIRIFILKICAIPMLLLLIIIDSGYYGYITMADIESLEISWNNWIVTPLNFLRYNADPSNLTKHGLHPRWLHIAVNVPLLFNVLGFIALYTVLVNCYRFICGMYSKMPRRQSIRGLMLLSVIIPLGLLSLFPHQEARFIIPLLVPLVYLYANMLHANDEDTQNVKKMKKFFLSIWYTLNIIFTVFFGFIHQGGIYPFVNNLFYEIKGNYGTHVHVITTHSYSIPTYLLQLESTTRLWIDKTTNKRYKVAPSTFLHKFGSMPMEELFTVVDDSLTIAEMRLHKHNRKYRLYLVSPCSLHNKVMNVSVKYHYMEIKNEYTYYPHFCTEALPDFPNANDHNCYSNGLRTNESQLISLKLSQRISCYLSKFCLRAYSIRSKGV
ncbi:unnamed protein product [Leptidea sinapis]|uniref:Mannosyltransferase n=1 Tax=Leptidea sinapis TaxID=189913 RepID=A0A5E4R6W1_9NEOP|nr:unnamed protein product [Leptidea sinapis]